MTSNSKMPQRCWRPLLKTAHCWRNSTPIYENDSWLQRVGWANQTWSQNESSIEIVENIENLSRIQRLNLELQNLDEENTRTQDEIENIKKSIQTLDDDITREKGIIIDANSNEKRLKEEKADLIDVDSKYFETEKLSNEELEEAKRKLREIHYHISYEQRRNIRKRNYSNY